MLLTICYHLLAPLIFGPPEQLISSTTSLNTSAETIYQLISGKTKQLPEPGLPLFVDVRDVAQAHVLGLKNDSVIGKRILLSGGSYTVYGVCRTSIISLTTHYSQFVQTVQLIAEKRPELKPRLPSLENAKPETRTISKVDISIAEKELGMSFTSYEKCLFDTIDALLEKENEWSGR